MAYVDLATIFDPAPDEAPPAEWGDQIRDNFEALPRGIVGHDEKTTSQGSITTVVDVSDMSVTFTAVAGRLYVARVQVLWFSTVATDQLAFSVTDGSNNVIRTFFDLGLANGVGVDRGWVTQPFAASGSQTVKCRAARNNGSGTLTIQGGSTFPSTLIVEDVGPA